MVTDIKAQKTATNRKKKSEMTDMSDGEENKDWWTKYFASVEKMIEAIIDVSGKKLFISSRLGVNLISSTVFLCRKVVKNGKRKATKTLPNKMVAFQLEKVKERIGIFGIRKRKGRGPF